MSHIRMSHVARAYTATVTLSHLRKHLRAKGKKQDLGFQDQSKKERNGPLPRRTVTRANPEIGVRAGGQRMVGLIWGFRSLIRSHLRVHHVTRKDYDSFFAHQRTIP